MFGQGGLDTISGGNGDDLINGGDGNDTLHGQDRNDSLNGGAGEDIFVFSDIGVVNTLFGSDTINGFVNDQDTLMFELDALGPLGMTTIESLLAEFAAQTDSNTVTLDFDIGEIITINSNSDFTINDLVDDIVL